MQKITRAAAIGAALMMLSMLAVQVGSVEPAQAVSCTYSGVSYDYGSYTYYEGPNQIKSAWSDMFTAGCEHRASAETSSCCGLLGPWKSVNQRSITSWTSASNFIGSEPPFLRSA